MINAAIYTIVLLSIMAGGWAAFGWVAALLIFLGAIAGGAIVTDFVAREALSRE